MRFLPVLRSQELPCRLRGKVNEAAEPFLCFLRKDANDIVSGPVKLVGSAQRRRRGAILQHGSIVLRRSEHAPEIVGVQDLTSQTVTPSLPFRLADSISAALGRPEGRQLSDSDVQLVHELEENYTPAAH